MTDKIIMPIMIFVIIIRAGIHLTLIYQEGIQEVMLNLQAIIYREEIIPPDRQVVIIMYQEELTHQNIQPITTIVMHREDPIPQLVMPGIISAIAG
jgi:hypothetical protein